MFLRVYIYKQVLILNLYFWVRIQKELISYLIHKNEEIRGKRLGQL
jgi:hypothetical protein